MVCIFRTDTEQQTSTHAHILSVLYYRCNKNINSSSSFLFFFFVCKKKESPSQMFWCLTSTNYMRCLLTKIEALRIKISNCCFFLLLMLSLFEAWKKKRGDKKKMVKKKHKHQITKWSRKRRKKNKSVITNRTPETLLIYKFIAFWAKVPK